LRDILLNEKLNATHARWKEAVLLFHIADVRHRPGKGNKAADSLSHMFAGVPKLPDDGHGWTVSEDWHSNVGLTHNLFHVTPEHEHDALWIHFQDEPMFLSVLDALLELDHRTSACDKKKARHRAQEFMIAEGKLWRVADGCLSRPWARLECVTQTEMVNLARKEHEVGGHFKHDMVKLALMDKYCGTRVDQAIVKGINDCGKCKNFGVTHIHSLFKPVTQQHPFELFVADYLSMVWGIGGYHTVALIMDTFTCCWWGFKLKTKGTAKTTLATLTTIYNLFNTPEHLMTDGGSHFDCKAVRDFCKKEGTESTITTLYSPWINGLIENGNRNLLSILHKLCTPGLGEDDHEKIQWENLLKNWPLHFNEAIRLLNRHLIPSLKCSPVELMLGLVINTNPTPIKDISRPTMEEQIRIHLAYTQQQHLDGYAHTMEHAEQRKNVFNRRLLTRAPGVVTFEKGHLVQVYHNDLTYTFKSEWKLLL